MQRFNDSLFGRGEPVYEFSPVAPSTASELEGIFSKGEICVSLNTTRHTVAIGESSGENIETARNCVDVSASFHVERERAAALFQ